MFRKVLILYQIAEYLEGAVFQPPCTRSCKLHKCCVAESLPRLATFTCRFSSEVSLPTAPATTTTTLRLCDADSEITCYRQLMLVVAPDTIQAKRRREPSQTPSREHPSRLPKPPIVETGQSVARPCVTAHKRVLNSVVVEALRGILFFFLGGGVGYVPPPLGERGGGCSSGDQVTENYHS